MKKTVAAALSAMMLLSAGTAMAASFPNFDFNGDIKAHYRWETKTGNTDTDGGKLWFRLNAKSELSKDVDFYTRLSVQKVGGDYIGADFDQAYYGNTTAASFDRVGFIIKGKDFTYNIGRQATTLGGLGLLYSTEGYMGINRGAIDGLVATGKSGATNLKIVAGQQWAASADKTKIYAVDASYSPAKAWTVGATIGKVDYPNATADTNHWAVNTAYSAGKAVFLGEYGKSSADTLNKAYAIGATYGFDSKNSAYVFYSKVEKNSDMTAGATDFDNDMKGMYYGFDHKISKDYTFSLFYKSMKYMTGTDADKTKTSLRTTVTYKF